MSVLVVSASLIAPKAATPQPCVKYVSVLSRTKESWDYSRHVSFYQPQLADPACTDFAVLVSQLQESLSKTLSVYYILAGRLEQAHRSSSSCLLNCNDSGVCFRVAHAHSRLCDWNDLEANSPTLHFLKPQQTFHSQAPLLQIQVTRFLCGSIAIGHAVCEAVIDGFSFFLFLRSWAEMHKHGKIPNPPPSFDSHLFKPRDPPRVTIPIRDYAANHSAHEFFLKNSSFSPPQSATKLFTFTADKVDALVREVQDGPYTYGAHATSFEAMAALIWKCITEARQMADDEITTFIYPVSLRDNIKRWEPHVPSTYFGNAVLLECVQATAGNIKSKHVSYGAQLIHHDLQNITVESMKSTIDWMHIQIDNDMHVKSNADLFSHTTIFSTTTSTLPMHDADFGWGVPLHISVELCPSDADTIAYMLPTLEGGRSRYLSVLLPQEHLHNLSTHPLFCAFAAPTKICLA